MDSGLGKRVMLLILVVEEVNGSISVSKIYQYMKRRYFMVIYDNEFFSVELFYFIGMRCIGNIIIIINIMECFRNDDVKVI